MKRQFVFYDPVLNEISIFAYLNGRDNPSPLYIKRKHSHLAGRTLSLEQLRIALNADYWMTISPNYISADILPIEFIGEL